jgi:hypothetical protein
MSTGIIITTSSAIQDMSIKSWFLIFLLINEFPTKQGIYFGIDVLVLHPVHIITNVYYNQCVL